MSSNVLIAIAIIAAMAAAVTPALLLARRIRTAGVAGYRTNNRPMAAITMTTVCATAAAVAALAPTGTTSGIYAVAATALAGGLWCVLTMRQSDRQEHSEPPNSPFVDGMMGLWTMATALLGLVAGCAAGTLAVAATNGTMEPSELIAAAVLGACALAVGTAMRVGDDLLDKIAKSD